MRVYLIATSKGGSGKTTLATQLASYFSHQRMHTCLVDADVQGSSTRWFNLRDDDNHLHCIDGCAPKWRKRLPAHVKRVVIDAPAGADASALKRFLKETNAVVVPIMPSHIDQAAVVPFLNGLSDHRRKNGLSFQVGLVASRIRAHTHSSKQLLETLEQWPYPHIGSVRDTQAYALLCGIGKSIFDFKNVQSRQQQETWENIADWLERA